MIPRPKISQNEWKTTEIGAFEVGIFAPFSCPDGDPVRVEEDVEAVDGDAPPRAVVRASREARAARGGRGEDLGERETRVSGQAPRRS